MGKKLFKCYLQGESEFQLILCDTIEEANNEDDYYLVEEYKEDTITCLDEDEEIVTYFTKDILEMFKDSKQPVYI